MLKPIEPKVVELHLEVEKMDNESTRHDIRIECTPKVTIIDILTDRILIKGNRIQQLLRGPHA
jgi:hypothetical protein